MDIWEGGGGKQSLEKEIVAALTYANNALVLTIPKTSAIMVNIRFNTTSKCFYIPGSHVCVCRELPRLFIVNHGIYGYPVLARSTAAPPDRCPVLSAIPLHEGK